MGCVSTREWGVSHGLEEGGSVSPTIKPGVSLTRRLIWSLLPQVRVHQLQRLLRRLPHGAGDAELGSGFSQSLFGTHYGFERS